MGRLNRRLGLPNSEEQEEIERQQYIESIKRQQETEREAYEQYIKQQQEEEERKMMEQYEQKQKVEDEYETYKDVPIKKSLDIKKKPTPKGYYETIIAGVPVDLHSLEEYIVKTSPFAIKTLLRFDNARNIEDIKNYSTKGGVSRKKLDSKFFILIILSIALAVGGIIVMFFMPELIAMFQGMTP